ncbi:ribonuclease H-like domain-containing protein [Tanacetum coccineum]
MARGPLEQNGSTGTRKMREVLLLETKYPIIDLEIYIEGTRKYWKIIRVGNHIEVHQLFNDMLKAFDRDDLVMLWSRVKEKFNSIEPTDDKEREIWVELKRLFEPDTDDELWKLQKHIHDLTWKLYDSCGVHHVCIEKGIDIYMLVEKEYPLSRGTLTLMMVAKLLVDQDNEISRELLRRYSCRLKDQEDAVFGRIFSDLQGHGLRSREVFECILMMKIKLVIKKLEDLEDYALWDVMENGNSFKPVAQTTTNADGTSTSLIPGPRNKPDLDTMSFDDLYNNFKIVEQEVKGTASSSSSLNSQNMAFVTASTQVNTANLSDDVVYEFLASQPNGSQLVYEDLEQIHEDDIEEIDLKWQLALLSMKTRRFFQKTGRKNTINGIDTTRYDKSKVECFNCHMMGHFARECRGPRHQDKRNRNQDSSRRTINVEDTSSKAMVAIDGACFDWSYFADDEIPTNMVLMVFSDSEVHNEKTCSKTCLKSFETLKTQLDEFRIEFNKFEFNLATYKRRLASVEEQLVFYKKNESEFEGYGPKTSKNVREDTSNEVRESLDAPMVKKLVLDDKLENKTIFPTIVKIEFVRPKQQEKPVRKPVKYAEMYSFDHVPAHCNYHQRKRVESRKNYKRVRILNKRTKTEAKQTKPSTGIERARKTEAEGKIVSQLAILGENISQEDLNLNFLRSLSSEWNTHVVVWRNKPDLDTMSFDDLYINFKIVEQEVKGTASSSSQNMDFVSSPSSTNEVNTAYEVSTANTQVSPASTQVSTASTQVSTANLSDDTVYAFLASQPNWSQLVYEDLEQIHEDDIEEMDLKWQLALLSMRTRRFFQKTGRKITINVSDIAGYDKSKVECFNCHKMGYFARECRGPRNQDSRNKNQDSFRRTINVEETSSKTMVAIDGAGFD